MEQRFAGGLVVEISRLRPEQEIGCGSRPGGGLQAEGPIGLGRQQNRTQDERRQQYDCEGRENR